MSTVNKLIKQYRESGVLFRANDGQATLTSNDINDAIKNIVIDKKNAKKGKTTDLYNTLQNESPPYSASLLGGINAPILWYNPSYSEAFQTPDVPVPVMGKRTLVAVIFKNGNINIRGGCAWDADSNLRDLGNVPNTKNFNKTTPASLFAELNVFNNIGNFCYNPPKSNNNNAVYNPLFLPRAPDNIASNEEYVNKFLKNVRSYKKTWVETLKNDAGGYNSKFGTYLTKNYGTGLESEILTEPKNIQPYYKKKFNLDEILCVAFVTDGHEHDTHPVSVYQKRAALYLNRAMGKVPGYLPWINSGPIDEIPLVSITEVALPIVPQSGSSVPKGSVGCEWVKYLICPGFMYTNPLKDSNFKLICDTI